MVEGEIGDVYTAAEIYIRGLEGSRVCDVVFHGGGFAFEEPVVCTRERTIPLSHHESTR